MPSCSSPREHTDRHGSPGARHQVPLGTTARSVRWIGQAGAWDNQSSSRAVTRRLAARATASRRMRSLRFVPGAVASSGDRRIGSSRTARSSAHHRGHLRVAAEATELGKEVDAGLPDHPAPDPLLGEADAAAYVLVRTCPTGDCSWRLMPGPGRGGTVGSCRCLIEFGDWTRSAGQRPSMCCSRYIADGAAPAPGLVRRRGGRGL
jgi:hypothetical protein